MVGKGIAERKEEAQEFFDSQLQKIDDVVDPNCPMNIL